MTTVFEPHRELPVLDRPIDNTALADYMTCPRKYYYGMVRHRRAGGRPSPAIAYGAAWHRMLEIHYKTGGDEELVLIALNNSWEDHGKEDDHRTKERAWLEYGNYVEKWGTPDQEDAKTLGFPEQPAVEISTNAIWDGALHAYAGKLDRIITQAGQLYVEDHKTTSQLGAYYFKQFNLDNQMMGYAYLGSLITGQRIAGVRINAHAIYKRESKFERHIVSFSDRRLKEWAENYNRWVDRLQDSYARNDFPGNYKACVHKYGFCQYMGVCSLPPELRDEVLEQDFDYNPWNPLEAELIDDAGGEV